jgi:uncharacterized RDD family membrane protein YckC
MAIFGLELAKAAPRYRRNRFLAFLIDIALVVAIWFVSYRIAGKPDFYSVKRAMDSAMLLPPDGRQEAMNLVFSLYEAAYGFGLAVWFAYEALGALALGGRTVGKLAMGLQIAPMNPKRGQIAHYALLLARSALKMLSLYLLQGFPFIICALGVLANANRSGFDVFVKTCVIEKPFFQSRRKFAKDCES